MILIAFLLLTASMVSLWIKRAPKIWGALLAVSLLLGLYAGLLSMLGLAWVCLLAFFWTSYREKPTISWFLAIVLLSLALKMHQLPGFSSIPFTSKFYLGMEGTLIGLFPLALIVPLSGKASEWQGTFRGTLVGICGIGLMAILALLTNTVSIDCKLPSAMAVRTFSNFFFTAIPEEGFFRGFLQTRLCRSFGTAGGLILTAVIFTATHIFWSPNLAVLAFVFIAGLLYGGVYLWSGRIEAAIATHFLLNLIHQSCFTYHAM